jgi:transcriptional regulator of arginine metabolism
LLEQHPISRQSQLVNLLRDEGFQATQSSVSRDLRSMRVAKQTDGYKLPDNHNGDGTLENVGEFIRDARAAGPHLLVVSTAIGAAQRVALVLDRLRWPEVVGTLSGDDTIFIATSHASDQRVVEARLREVLE